MITLGAVWKKLSPQEVSSGAYTVLLGSVMAPSGFSSGKPLATKFWLQNLWGCASPNPVPLPAGFSSIAMNQPWFPLWLHLALEFREVSVTLN